MMPVSKSESKHDAAEAQLEYQQELEQLQRQYRKMKNEKKSYKVETNNILRRQECEIENLRQEHEDIQALLKVALGRYNQEFDRCTVKSLNNLLVKDSYAQEILQKDKSAVASLDKRIVNTKEEVFNREKEGRSESESSSDIDQFSAGQRQIRILENRVYNANIRFNRSLSENSKLKSNIHFTSFQKMRFRELFRRLNRVFENGKTEIDSVVESSLNYFHARDEAQHRMAFLREKAERDLALYNMELKDVMRVIDHDRKLRDFMSTKTEDRSEILEKAIFKRQNKRMSNLLSTLKVEATKYEEIFSKIKEVTGIEDNDQLVERFITIEDENFAQFNYINELSTEIEALQEEIKEQQKDMADIKQNCTQIDKRRKEILSQLEVRFAEVTEKKQKRQGEYKLTKRILEQVKPRVEHTFKSVKCNRAAITDLLGNTAGLTDDNVMAFMGIIEQRTNELLQIHCMQKLKFGVGDETNKQVADTIFPVAASNGVPLSIKPPSIDEDTDAQCGLFSVPSNQPLSFKETQAAVMKAIMVVQASRKDQKKFVRSAV